MFNLESFWSFSGRRALVLTFKGWHICLRHRVPELRLMDQTESRSLTILYQAYRSNRVAYTPEIHQIVITLWFESSSTR